MGSKKSTWGRLGPEVVFTSLAALVLATTFILGPVGATAKKTALKPVTVAMISQITGSSFGSPETVDAAKAVVKQINAEGGLGGHPIKLTTCNDKEDPTDGGNCARSAVADKAVAVVEGISLQDGTMLPILNAAGIPLIESPTAPQDWTNSQNFPTDAGTISLWGGEGVLLAEEGCQKIGILFDNANPTGGAGPGLLSAGVNSTNTGATVVGSVGVSDTSPELTPAIAQLESEGATCIGTTLVPAELVDAVTAARQSADPTITIATIGPAFPEALADQLGATADGVLVDSVSYLPTDPRAAAFTKVMAPYGKADETSFAENVYGGFKILQAAVKSHKGALTAAAVKHALNTSSKLVVSTYPHALEYNNPNQVSAYSRLTNMWVVDYKFNGSTFVPLTGKLAEVNAEGAL